MGKYDVAYLVGIIDQAIGVYSMLSYKDLLTIKQIALNNGLIMPRLNSTISSREVYWNNVDREFVGNLIRKRQKEDEAAALQQQNSAD